MTDKKNIDIKSVEMAKVEDLALDISWCVAEEAAEYLEIIMQGLTKDGIRSLMHIIDGVSGELLVEVIKSLFIMYQMQEAENILVPLQICARYCEDTYSYFYDCFCNTDIIDSHLVDYWISEYESGREDDDD